MAFRISDAAGVSDAGAAQHGLAKGPGRSSMIGPITHFFAFERLVSLKLMVAGSDCLTKHGIEFSAEAECSFHGFSAIQVLVIWQDTRIHFWHHHNHHRVRGAILVRAQLAWRFFLPTRDIQSVSTEGNLQHGLREVNAHPSISPPDVQHHPLPSFTSTE